MRDGVQSVINPFDANGVETALQLKEQCGGKVIAISMGPPQADDVLKNCLLSSRLLAQAGLTLTQSYQSGENCLTVEPPR